MQTKLSGTFSVAIIAALTAQPALAHTYIVKQGDTLSAIAQREVGAPVWGDAGSLRKVLEWNPDIKNPNLIAPNQVIQLAPAATQPASAEALVAAANDESPAADAAAAPSPDVAASAEGTPTVDVASDDANAKPSQFELSVEGIVSDDILSAEGVATDWNTKLESKIKMGLRAELAWQSTATWRFAIFGEGMSAGYKKTSDGIFVGNNESLKAFGATAAARPIEDLEVGVGYALKERMFLSGSSTSLEAAPVYVDQASVFTRYDIATIGDATVGAGANASYLAKAKGDALEVKSGSAYGGELRLRWRLSDSAAATSSVFVDKSRQNSDFAKQEQLDSGVRVGINLGL